MNNKSLLAYIKRELTTLPSDESISKFPNSTYAHPYYQGRFDSLMNLKLEILKGELK